MRGRGGKENRFVLLHVARSAMISGKSKHRQGLDPQTHSFVCLRFRADLEALSFDTSLCPARSWISRALQAESLPSPERAAGWDESSVNVFSPTSDRDHRLIAQMESSFHGRLVTPRFSCRARYPRHLGFGGSCHRAGWSTGALHQRGLVRTGWATGNRRLAVRSAARTRSPVRSAELGSPLQPQGARYHHLPIGSWPSSGDGAGVELHRPRCRRCRDRW